MEIEYKNAKVNYITKGSGKKVILFLHGWGGNTQSFMPVCNVFKEKCILIDFPPFGKSEEPKEVYTLFDYAEIVYQILQKENVKCCDVISHSFGSRVAIIMQVKYKVFNKIVITGGAGIRPKNSIKKFCRKVRYKIIKTFNKNAVLGSKDYVLLSKVMKKTFSNIVNFDLSNYAKKIDIKTLLIYGKNDKETPLYMAKKFNKLIKKSSLKIYKNCGHFAYLENLEQFLLDVKIFIRE